MEYIYHNNPSPDTNYDGPSDEEPREIEEEVEKYSD